MQPYKSVRQGNLVELVFEQIKQDIISKNLKPGDKLPPQDVLTGQFGVSRTVIREAQKKLASLGLVENRQGSGTYVRRPSLESVMEPMLHLVELDADSTAELMETRFHLENLITRLAAQRADTESATKLMQFVDEMALGAAQDDLEAFNRADLGFHMQLAVMSCNRVMAKVMETIQDMTRRFLQTFSRSEGAMDRAIKFHRAIASAVAANDPDRAEKHMQAHLEDIAQNLRHRFDLELRIKSED